ncbi:hypothetical protein HK100_007450, partial [Physocladia obscura]
MLLGLSTLRDLINLRPAVRPTCTKMLLHYCTSPDKILRSNAILIARRWISPDHTILGPIIEAHATEMLHKLSGPPPGDDEEEEEGGGAAWEEIDSIRHFELFFAITSKKHVLLRELMRFFGKLMPETASVILAQIEPLVKSMAAAAVTGGGGSGGGLADVVGAMREFPDGSDMLVRRIVDILTDGGGDVHTDVVAAVVDIVEEK